MMNKFSKPKPNIRAAILAGGRGTRLYPPAQNGSAKVLAEIDGRPFIHFLIEMLARRGIREVVMCVGYLGREVEARLGDGRGLGSHIEYVYDYLAGSTLLLGTAGAVHQALPRLGEHFWVINGDTYLDIDYNAVYEYYSANSLDNMMLVYRNQNRWWPSNVVLSNGWIEKYDKLHLSMEMDYIDAGVGILKAEIFNNQRTRDLSELYVMLAKEHRLAAYEVLERFYEINTSESLAEAARYLTGLRI